MARRTQQFIAAFVIAAIVILALCGFLAVDLSTDRYMPSDQAPLLELSAVGSEGVRFAALGRRYEIRAEDAAGWQEALWQWRGMLPGGVLEAGASTAKAYVALKDYLRAQKPPEEPW